MTSNQIKFFLTAVECMNFSNAAEKLFISQPALSRGIASLEDEIGIKLFFRNNNVLELTPGGEVLYKWFNDKSSEFEGVIARARQKNKPENQFLTLGIVRNDTLPQAYADGLAKFIADNPNIDVRIHHSDFASDAVRDTINHDLDINVLMASAIFDEPDLISIPICTYRRSIAVSLNHPLANKTNASLRDFKDDKFIVINAKTSPSMMREIHHICNQYGFEPQVIEGPNIQRVMEMIEEGKGVGLLYVGHAERYNTLVKFVDIKENITVDQVLSYCKDNTNPNIKKFIDSIL